MTRTTKIGQEGRTTSHLQMLDVRELSKTPKSNRSSPLTHNAKKYGIILMEKPITPASSTLSK
uniref:Uncharacterized protein MANES_12G020700 n=1 Tax=Rhizophora mucronata TaxID=61149 RepID=A0A2P2LIZ5_RHIMU